jgi:hypothetical protein
VLRNLRRERARVPLQFVLARFLVTLALAGCSFDKEATLGGSITVDGDVVDFQNGAPVTGDVSVTASGITPPPVIRIEGSTFSITDVPENTVFQVLASAADHRPTFSDVITITDADLHDVHARVVGGAYIDGLAAAFGITPTAAKGIVIVKLVDAAGNARPNIPAAQLLLAGSTMGPYFLDAQGNAAPTATASTTSGYAIWFECLPGITAAGQAATATITVDMAISPVAAGHITLALAVITDGAPPPLPTNVSFAQTVVPIFTARGCVACHGGNGPGKALGGLDLNGGVSKLYGELVEERPNVRVNTAMPEASLVLTKPLFEVPPNHQNGTFQNTQDPDYRKILAWIKEGAKDN